MSTVAAADIARIHSPQHRPHRHRCPERRLRRELGCRRGDFERSPISFSAPATPRPKSSGSDTLQRNCHRIRRNGRSSTRSRLQKARRSSRRPMATPSRTRTSRRSSPARTSATSSSPAPNPTHACARRSTAASPAATTSPSSPTPTPPRTSPSGGSPAGAGRLSHEPVLGLRIGSGRTAQVQESGEVDFTRP